MLCSIITLLATNCGGGGGGGGGPTNVRQPIAIQKEPTRLNYNNDNRIENIPIINANNNYNAININENKFDNFDVPKPFNSPDKITIQPNGSYKYSYIQNEASNNDGFQNKRMTVAIMDSDFLTDKKNLESKYPDITILQKISRNKNPNESEHGKRVLSILNENQNFKIIAASIGEKRSGKTFVVPSLELYKKTFENLKNEKVKIINQSWGADYNKSITEQNNYKELLLPTQLVMEDETQIVEYIKDVQKRGEDLINFYEETVNNGGLFIWANGNYDSNNQTLSYPTLQAQLPVKHSGLKKGWISVIGIDPNVQKENGEYFIHKHYTKHLAYPANASYWAISASAEGLSDANNTLGSSYAAPRVARAAALVAKKYDWMTNSQIRDTLLTTTDNRELKSDEKGNLLSNQQIRYTNNEPHNLYGWGVLNTERALKGPGAFNEKLLEHDSKNRYTDGKLYFMANLPKNRISSFENDIYGDGGLVKKGLGRLQLKGDNTYSGKTFVEEGILDIYKSTQSGVVVKENGALVLHENSVIGKNHENIFDDGSLSNEGIVKLAGKTATITGDYIATKNAKTEIDFGSKLTVLGTTKLNETTINLKSNSYPGKKEVKELITSNKFEGDINKLHINVDGMRNANISKNNDKIMVEMSRESAISYLGTKEESSINTAKNIENVLQELDVKIENNSANEKDLLLGKSIVEMSTSQFDNATKKMSGEIYASAQSLTFAQAENINKNLSNHLSSLEDFKNSNYEWQGWMSGILTHGKLQQSGYASAKTKMQGGQFGIDKKINPTTQLGLSFSYSYANADFNQYAGNSKSDGIGTSIYGKKYLNDNYYLLGRVGVSKFSTRVKRELLDAKLNTVQGDIKHHDTMISSYIEIGKHFNYFTPFIGYSYDYLKRGSFNEGNAEWGIQAKSKDYFKSNILLGLRGEYKVDSYKFTSYVSHSINVGNRNLDFTGNFTGSTINQTFKGIKQVKNTTWVGFGISKEISPQFTINGNFDMRFEENKKSDSIVSLGLDYRF